MNLARQEVLRMLAAQLARDEAAALEGSLAKVSSLVAGRLADGPAIAQAARGAAQQADAIAARFAQQDFDAAAARSMVKALTADIVRVANAGVHAAEQATMTLDTLGAAAGTNPAAFQAAIAKVYDYLEHPSTYQPAEFAAQFRKVAGMLN